MLSVETITSWQPTGQWRAQVIGRSSLLRSGERAPLDYRQQPNMWTFTSESCSADGCTGTVSSSSGRDFPYAWDGRELVVDRRLLTDKSGMLACTDETGEAVPISEGAAVHTYRYRFGSFVGSADRLASRVVIEISTEFIGSCQATPDDAITYVEDQVLTKLPEGSTVRSAAGGSPPISQRSTPFGRRTRSVTVGDMTMTTLDDELTRQLMHQRIVVLGEALEEGNGNRLMHQLLLLSAEDKRADISLWINSPGGSVSAMLAIRDVMRLIPNDVATLAMGMAASAGQFLLSAGTPGKRHALPHARILLHQGSAGIGGTAMDIEIQAKDLRYTRDTVLALVAEDTGQPVEIIERDSRRDRWFSAQEAMDYGFVDQVVSSVDDVAPSGGRTARRPGGGEMSTYTIPYVVQQTPRGERTVDLYSRLLSDRIIYLGTEIDDGVANAVIAQLLHLASEAPTTPISLYINSPGGSITAMLAIYDAMQFVSSPVETTCVGQAAWTAAVLLAGGEPGRRQMLPHARVVLHQPAMSQRGTIPDLIVEADEVARVRALLEEILAHHTGRTADQVREDTDRDLVLPGQAAVDYGIADAVLTSQVPVGG